MLIILFNLIFVIGNLFLIIVFYLQGPIVYKNEEAQIQLREYYTKIKIKLTPLINYIKNLLDSKYSLDYIHPITLFLFVIWCYTGLFKENYYFLHLFLGLPTLISYACYAYIIYTQGFWTWNDKYEIEDYKDKYLSLKAKWDKIQPYIFKAFSHHRALDVMHPIAEGLFYCWFICYWLEYFGWFILITPILILSYISFFSIIYIQGFWTYLDKVEIREITETFYYYKEKFELFKKPIIRFLESPLAFHIAYHLPKVILGLWFIIVYSLR